MLNWHEVVNDRLGGRAIAVTYSPLGDAAVVLGRDVAGELLTFGVSGLLYNSNTLIYDRRPAGRAESLWAPLQFRAVAGPAAAAARTLTAVPFQLTSWDVWRAHHPGTTVLWPDPGFRERYGEDPYSSYYGGNALRFPVWPLPLQGPPRKTPVLVLGTGAEHIVMALPAVASRAAGRGFFDVRLGHRDIRLHASGTTPVVYVEALDGGEPPLIAHALWFAWAAMHPDDKVAP
jgi:hypothetical protein